MLINEMSKKTGVSKKAIYIYESKGLLSVKRLENGYRVYSEEDAARLNKIKLLRLAGISIADIKLLFDNVVTIAELTEKRKKEIEKEYGSHSEQLDLCDKIIGQYNSRDYDVNLELNENDSEAEHTCNPSDVFSVGLDVGTTTISAAVINITEETQSEFFTIANNCRVAAEDGFALQSAEGIFDKVKKLLDHILKSYTNVKSIGVTGQMHGIVYVDKNGEAVSEFITWQDSRADEIYKDGTTYCGEIYKKTGEKVASGFGLATHFYNVKNKLVPKRTHTFCNIADYIVMRLTGNKEPIIHNSIAASFGMFDIKKSEFKAAKLAELGMDDIVLPRVTDDFYVCGEYGGAKICVGIGDNQAGVLGSVDDLDGGVLVNIGTGSQISAVCDVNTKVRDGAEIRPLVKGKYIFCGSALCGGAAYALCEKFFRDFTAAAGGNGLPVYEVMNALAGEAYNEGKEPLKVNTCFCGTRINPSAGGSVDGITSKNFTADRFILGVINGMCTELYSFFGQIADSNKKSVIASGNAVRKNKVFKKVISDIFGMPVKIPKCSEEAAVGAAMFSAVSARLIGGAEDIKRFIEY